MFNAGKVHIKSGTWCKDAYRIISCLLHDTRCKYTTWLETDVKKARNSYWSVSWPMDNQNRHFAMYSLLKEDKRRYRQVLSRELYEKNNSLRNLSYRLHQKGINVFFVIQKYLE